MARRRPARLVEATLTSVRASDFVTWASSSGSAKGRVLSVHKGKVPGVPMRVSGTDVQPAARIELYKEQDGGGWGPTGQYVGLSTADLTGIEALPAAATEAYTVTAGSFDEIRQNVQGAIKEMLEQAVATVGGETRVYVYVSDIGPDWAVYSSGYDDDYFQVPYSIDAAGVVTLGTPAEVRQVRSYEPVADEPVVTPPVVATAATSTTASEAVRRDDMVDGRLLEAKGTDEATGGRIFGVRIIAVGDSKNGRRYGQKVLEAAAPLYEGAKAFDHHRTDDELKSSTINGLVGSYRNVEAKTDGLYADLYLLPSATHTAETLDASLDAQAQGLPALVGISHDAMTKCTPVVEGGRRLLEATEIVSVNSADVVADPAAGGQATRMVAGGIDTKENEMPTLDELLSLLTEATPEQLAAAGISKVAAPPAATTTTESVAPPAAGVVPVATIARESLLGRLAIKEAVTGAGLPEQVVEAVTKLLPEQFTEADLPGHIGGVKTLLGGLELGGLVPTVPTAEVTQESHDKKVAALNAMFDGNYSTGFKSLKEAYCEVTGDFPKSFGEDFSRKILRESHGVQVFDSQMRATESVDSGTWNTILGDAITRRMIAEYAQPSLQTWRQIVSSIVPVNDFRTQRIERMGGYGVLPDVNQGAPYQPLTSPGDEEVTYAITKRGGTEDLTLETIANDDLRAVQRIPIKLGLAAAQTLFRFVWDTLANNPTIYDGVALFAAGHANVDAGNTLSQTNLSTGRRKMRQQTAYGDSSDVLSIVPKFLVVPSSLEELAFQLCTSAVAIPATPAGAANTPNIHQGLTPIVLDYLSAQATWFLLGDPAMCPTFELGFYQGRQDPDLFVQADPTVGSSFNADKITYKIRHIYSGAVTDYRPWYRGN